MNTFGNIFRLTTAGESHGAAITGIVDGMPAGIPIDIDAIDRELANRRPGSSDISSQRREPDKVHILSGVFEGVSTGAPIAFLIVNSDSRPEDYEHLRNVFRPSHADCTYHRKYGIRDHRGGGRASARETAMRVVAGALAMAALSKMGINITAYTQRIGNISFGHREYSGPMDEVYAHTMRCPDASLDTEMLRLVRYVREAGDSIGGIVGCTISGLPEGLGEPVYGKFQSMLASAMMSINAAKGFDYGMGFDGVCRLGSEMNDNYISLPDGSVSTLTNHSGGIQGGITTGRPVYFRVAFKPVATLMREVAGIDTDGHPVLIKPRGRHDTCIVPRAVAVVRAMAAVTTLDAVLMARSSRWQ